MMKINRLEDCCGCTACESVCNQKAIKMTLDTLGFLYPNVDKSKCTDFGLCEKVCAFNDTYDISHLNIDTRCFAARLKDVNMLRFSRSGGVFVALSDIILNSGGVVYGAGYAQHFVVVHKRATTQIERNEFRGSKYVQSDMRGVFQQVKEDLRNGRTVLFSGTPCQIAGLSSYIGKRLRNNLILVDIICHAVPSPYIWRDYLAYMEEKYKSKVIKIEFRDKSIGWCQPHLESFFMENGETHKDFLLRHLFYEGLCTRPSCSECHYTNLNRPSDITIGDYWGFEKTVPEMNRDNKGVSIVLCNTSKGLGLFNQCKEKLIVTEVSKTDAMQHNLHSPSPIHHSHVRFAEDYKNKGFLYIAKKYGNWGIRYKIDYTIKRIKSKFNL